MADGAIQRMASSRKVQCDPFYAVINRGYAAGTMEVAAAVRIRVNRPWSGYKGAHLQVRRSVAGHHSIMISCPTLEVQVSPIQVSPIHKLALFPIHRAADLSAAGRLQVRRPVHWAEVHRVRLGGLAVSSC